MKRARVANPRKMTIVVTTIVLAWAGAILAQTGGGYDLTWSTIDGGGQTFSTGGAYALGGTTGQCDAGPTNGSMTGGSYSLVGGFWPASVCVCISDMNYDKLRNAKDVQTFVLCFLGSGSNCGCADLNHDGNMDDTDMSLFVSGLLATTPCP